MLGHTGHRGRLAQAGSYNAVAILGHCLVDVRESDADQPTVNAFVLLGAVRVIASPDQDVRVRRFPLLGWVSLRRAP